MNKALLALPLAFSFVTAACGDSNEVVIDPGDNGNYAPAIDPANYVLEIDNPFFPLIPGSRWVYESEDGAERIETVVLEERRTVMGISAVVIRDTVREDGEVIEDTYDWYAQDRDGNVWYLGEDSTDYEDGKAVSKHGSWEGGVDGAIPGIVMLANPAPGRAYRQEYYKGEAEDLAEIVGTGKTAKVPAGDYTDLVVIKEWNPLDPGVVEEKYYATGVGMVLEVKTKGGDERVGLVSYEAGK